MISKNITSKKNLKTENKSTLNPLINWTLSLQGFSTLIMMIIWFLLPLKYGGSVNPTYKSTWNQDLFSWIYAGWPVFTFPLISAVSFLVVLLNRRGFSRNSLFICLLMVFPGLMIFFASLIGWINTTEKDVAYLFSTQILAVVILVSASIIHIQAFPSARRLILISICIGFLTSSAFTWHQKYLMYPMVQKNLESRIENLEQINSNGLDHSGLKILRNKNRFGGTFPYSNHLGAHLILLFPVCILIAWRSGRYIEPARASSIFISFSVVIFILGTLWISGSLASALILTIMIFGLSLFWIIKSFYWKKRAFLYKLKYLLLFTLITICFGILFQEYILPESKLLSLQRRFGHWDKAIQMFIENPLAGVGMGEFYPHYVQKKPPHTETIRFAHNLFLCFLSQCGIFGGIASLMMLFYPVWLMILVMKRKLRMQSKSLFYAVFGGSLAWSFHSLLDFNIQVPATVSTFLILPSLGLNFQKDNVIFPIRKFMPIGVTGLLLIGICLIPLDRIEGEKNYKRLEQLIKNGASEKQIYEIGEKASQKLPHSPYPPFKIAQVAIQLHQYEYAVLQLKESIKRTPHRSSYHAWIAQVYTKMGKKDDALVSIEQALLWYPSNNNYKKIKDFLNDS